MKKIATCLLLVTALGLSLLPARSQTAAQNAVLKLDPALDKIISSDAKLEILKGDYFGFIEGPVWTKEAGGGYLLFSDIAGNRIYKWDPKAGLSIFLEKSGYTGTAVPMYPNANVNCSGRACVVLVGSNGLARDREGRLIVCTHGDRILYRLEKDGTRTTLVDRYDGKHISGPNDLAVKSDGSIYFSDRGSGLISGTVFPKLADNPARELDYNAIMRWKDGKVNVLLKDDRVNGLAFSPDEKYLYVILSGPINRYEVQPDGSLANPTLFVDTTVDKTPGAPDGMKVDRNGNVFTTGPGGVWIVSPEGKVLGKIRVPDPIMLPANLSFGDADGRGLYLTGRNTLSYIRLNAPAF